jgi:hypothetical protein
MEPGYNTGLDVSYFLSKRFLLTAHWNYGSNAYYEKNHPKYHDVYPDDGTSNARLRITNFGLLAGYCLPIGEWTNITGQIGFSQYTSAITGFSLPVSYPDLGQSDVATTVDYVFYSAAFPVKFSAGIAPFKHLNVGFARNIEIGYALGWYMEPDFGFFTGVYHGPQVSISF